jgi:hypothetical protein
MIWAGEYSGAFLEHSSIVEFPGKCYTLFDSDK